MDLNPSQIARLEKILRAGFRFITLERYARYFGIERDGFVVLIDPGHGGLMTFGQPGYLMGDGIAVLVERVEGKAFVWHEQSKPATPDLMDSFVRFRADVEDLLKPE